MNRFPPDAALLKVLNTLKQLGFRMIREGSHIAMQKKNPDGTCILLTIPNFLIIKKSTLRTILTQSRISRDDFLRIYFS